jgi:PAS domain S-box-containing protein
LPEPSLTTEQLGAETIRRQMEQFFDATSDGIHFLDRNWTVTYMNRRAREILGPSGDLIGTNVFERFPEAGLPDSPFYQNYCRSMVERVSTSFEAYYPDPLNMWLRITAHPTGDGIIVFFRDVTTEKRASEELHFKREEAERQFAEIEAVYRTAPIGLALFDLEDYRYLRLNDRQAAFFGLKPEQIIGKTLTEMAPIDGLRELFDKVAAGEPVINFPLEGALVTDPGEYRYWTVSYYPVLSPDGKVQGITAASLEITQQKKAELALIESDKLAVVGRLASSIAHEINNPLESITNLLYLARHSDTLEESKDYLTSAEHELQRMAAVTSQTLRFHKQATSPQEITGESLIRSVLSIYRGRITNSGAIIETRYRATHPVRCFEGEIRQVISNLLGNALDALPPNGKLFLRSREGTNHTTGQRGVILTVADSGSGMSPETLEKAFRPFYTTKGITGTGLGLWICKEIIDRHNGAIHARSCAGAGTVFTIFLPFNAATR